MDSIKKLILVVKTLSNFWIALLDKIGFIKSEVIYSARNGLKFIARGGTEDMAEIVVVVSGDEYRISPLSLSKQPIIFDLGGHIGTFSISMAKRFKAAKIFAYEPDSDNSSYFQKNIKLNKIKNVTLVNSAVSNYVGDGFLKKVNLKTDAYFLEDNKKSVLNCAVTTIQEEARKYNLSKIDILKIDIEGGEYAIFNDKKSYSFISKKVKHILIECHNINRDKNEKKLIALIKKNFTLKNHYKTVYIFENNLNVL
jgi:FkbM family methyltransferase